MRSTSVRRQQSHGFTLLEMISVVALAGLVLGISLVNWPHLRARAESHQAASLTRTALRQARSLAVHLGYRHWVVLEPAQRQLRVFADADHDGELDLDADRVVERIPWPPGVRLALPAGTTQLGHPTLNMTLVHGVTEPGGIAVLDDTEHHVLMARPDGAGRSPDDRRGLRGTVLVYSSSGGTVNAVVLRTEGGEISTFRLTEDGWVPA
ncbi:MAG: type II secretion system protein [Acidobacteriota bacterium]